MNTTLTFIFHHSMIFEKIMKKGKKEKEKEKERKSDVLKSDFN